MKKIICLCLIVLLVNLNAKDFKNISLVDFVQIISSTTNKNIVMSDSIKKDFHIYLPNYHYTNSKNSINLLYNILKINNLDFKSVANVILIYRPLPKPKIIKKLKKPVISSYVIPYKFLTNEDIRSFFALFPSVRYVNMKNRLLLFSTKDKFLTIKKNIISLDSSYLQRNIKITILSTQDKNNYDFGTDFHISIQSSNYYISLLTSNVNFSLNLPDLTKFFSFINLMKSKGYSKLLDNPNLLLFDNKDSLIDSTQNIPYLTQTTSTKDNTTTTQNSYKYKDVGLKVKFTNVVVTKDYIYADLDIFIQSILDQSLTPVVGSRHISTHLSLPIHKSIIIGGLTSHLSYNSRFSIPFIDDVPVLGYITSHKTKEHKNETFTIIISN